MSEHDEYVAELATKIYRVCYEFINTVKIDDTRDSSLIVLEALASVMSAVTVVTAVPSRRRECADLVLGIVTLFLQKAIVSLGPLTDAMNKAKLETKNEDNKAFMKRISEIVDHRPPTEGT